MSGDKNDNLDNKVNMNDKATNDIDEQLVSSIQKLVEEETNVARAFVDYHSDSNNSQESANSESINADMHTQVIPDVAKELAARKSEAANQEQSRQRLTSSPNNTNLHPNKSEVNTQSEKDNIADNDRPDESQDNDEGKKKLSKKTKITIGVAAGVVAAILIITIIVVSANSNKKKSYDYNYKTGIEYFNDKDYLQAITYLEKAAQLEAGKNNAELKYDLYLCYRNTENTDKAIKILKDILTFDKNNEKSIKALALLYLEKNDNKTLNEFVHSYVGTDGEEYLSEYIVKNPIPSTEEGEYNDNVKLQFVVDSDCKVYYTLDGSTPTAESTLYNGIIEIKSGTTTVKAIAVSSMKIYSDVVELKYVIDYKKPDSPSISPASGAYESGQMVTVDTIPDGVKFYYTLDGTDPTEQSTEYTEPFSMTEGNIIVSMIAIDQNKQSSSIVRRNYVVSKTKQYTSDEAISILKVKLQNLGVLSQDGTTTSDGGNAAFSNQGKKTIQGVEVYYIRYNVKKNGTSSTETFYGVGVSNGNCYVISGNNTMTEI